MQCTANLEPFLGGGKSVLVYILSSLAPCQDRRQKEIEDKVRVVKVGGVYEARQDSEERDKLTWRSETLFTFHWHNASLTVQGLL